MEPPLKFHNGTGIATRILSTSEHLKSPDKREIPLQEIWPKSGHHRLSNA